MIRRINEILKHEGIRGFIRKCYGYIRHKFYDQWHFVYFAFPLTEEFIFPQIDSFSVRKATRDDLPRIQSELFPYMKESDGDKRYLDRLGSDGIECFVVEHEGKFVHFSLVFTDFARSPMMGTRLSKDKLENGDVFIGPLFTVPHARGAWIFPSVLAHILRELKGRRGIRRALVFVYDKNPGAIQFYERLGFERI